MQKECGSMAEETVKCPVCGVELPVGDIEAQMRHMDKQHPEVVAKRVAEADRLKNWATGD